jgi:YjbE family integral membrane protein
VEFGTPQFWVAASRDHRHQHPVVGRQRGGDRARLPQPPAEAEVVGIFWGVVGAVVLRVILTFFAVQLLLLPYLQLVGAALLIWIGIKLIAEDEGDEATRSQAATAVAAVKTVIVADLVMSIDNVIGVAGAAKGSLSLLIFGLVVSIPLVVLGSQLIMKLIERSLARRRRRRPAGLHRRRNRHRRTPPSSRGSPPMRRAALRRARGGRRHRRRVGLWLTRRHRPP